MPPEWECLPRFVSKRLGLLLSSLSLCLRFGSLTQFPPTLDLYRFAIACRGGFAGARCSTHYQDDMHCQMIRLHQNKMSRAAADSRSKSNRIATPRTGQCNRQALQLFELLACNGKRLSFGRATPVFFLGKENGGRIRAAPAALLSPRPQGASPFEGYKKGASLRDTPFYHPNRVWSKGFLLPFRALRAL